MFLPIKTVTKDIKPKENFEKNYSDNILRHFDGWVNFAFTTNETKRDY